MTRRKGLKKLFNRFAATALLSAGLLAGCDARAEGPQAQPPSVQFSVAAAPDASDAPLRDAVCAAYPGFEKPVGPMHRVARSQAGPDPAVQKQQRLLRLIGIDAGFPDGLRGNSTRAGGREYLMFYAPLYGGDAQRPSLDAQDAEQLEKFAQKAQQDAKAKGLRVPAAAALRLATERTGADFNALVAAARRGGALQGVRGTGAAPGDLFKFDNPAWLYLVKEHGEKYGLGLYARHITLAEKDGKTVPAVDNPFLHRQLLELRHHPRLSALMAAEYLVSRPDLSNVVAPKLPVYDATAQQQQRDLAALGFDIGAGGADGVKGTYAEISIGEFQLIYGEGTATGTLSAAEADILKKAAARARQEARKFGAPSVAAGAIRLASERSAQDFGYMMELAAAESGFSHSVRASTSTATGLYQFIESTWAWMIKLHGARYGLSDFAREVEIYSDDLGRKQARINNPVVRRQIMELRRNPHLSSLFSAHFQQENKAKEACWVEGEIARADLYLAHFLGAHDAVYFINEMRDNPRKSAAATFPEAAEANQNIFYVMQNGQRQRARTLSEVYGLFEKKFDRKLFDGISQPLVRGPDDFPSPIG